MTCRIDDVVPDDGLANWKIKQSLMKAAGGPLRRLLMKRWIGGLDPRGIVRKMHAVGGPSDVVAQQEKVAQVEALAFISPVYFVRFPAILNGSKGCSHLDSPSH
jgi:NAD(P)H dehydrogenase (quinone)